MNDVMIQTKVKNSSIRISKIDGAWYIIPVGFPGMHLTPAESECIIESFREATARAIAMNAMRDTDNLFVEKQNAEQ